MQKRAWEFGIFPIRPFFISMEPTRKPCTVLVQGKSVRARRSACLRPAGRNSAQAGQAPNYCQCFKFEISNESLGSLLGHWKVEFRIYLKFVIWNLEFLASKDLGPFSAISFKESNGYEISSPCIWEKRELRYLSSWKESLCLSIFENLLKERVDLATIIVIIIERDGNVQKFWSEKRLGMLSMTRWQSDRLRRGSLCSHSQTTLREYL